MDTAQWTQSVGVIVGIAGALVGIAGALVVSFWRGATLAQTITQAITESEQGFATRTECSAGKSKP